MVLPRDLNDNSIIAWSREKKRLQIVENRVWRQILGAPVYAQLAALYGEIGATTLEGWDGKIKLKFV